MARDSMLDGLPDSARIDAAIAHCRDMALVRSITGDSFTKPEQMREYSAFLSGYDHAMEHGHGEILAENISLQSERFDLTVGQHRVIQLEALFSECASISAMHDEPCGCDICRLTKQFLDSLKGA